MSEVVEGRASDVPGAAWAGLELDDPRLYINRELSLLEFQRRVLEEAQDPDNPVMERAKFLAIVHSNLDEFFMVRVAGLMQQVAAGVGELSPDGLTPAEQLAQVRPLAQTLMEQAQRCYLDDVAPGLDAAGIHLMNYADLDDEQRAMADRYFDEVVFPVLTPLAFDPSHPFPHISHLSLNLAILIKDASGRAHFARLKVPRSLPRLVPVQSDSGGVREDGTVPHHHYFVWLEQLVSARLETLFPGMEVVESHPFHITRDADLDIQELEASDLLVTIEQGLRQRRFGTVVRVIINPGMSETLRDIILSNLSLDRNAVYVLDGPLDLSSLMRIQSVDRFDLKYPSFKPAMHPAFDPDQTEADVFSAIRQEDLLVHHPYDSFAPVVEFLKQAARDPDVLAIKATLYRVGSNSPVVRALLRAREMGKQVAVLVELKARFDEESNIGWARALEREGVHVVYGLVGLKTHAKIALVVRKEGDRIRRYVHLSTGNYNAVTSHIYTDVGMFTCDEEIGADASDLFNFLTGYSAKRDYRKLIVAPVTLRDRLQGLIRREIEHARQGRPARLIFKFNALVDTAIIRLLYEASQAGVRIDLLVRGICCLRPGVPGVSEHIQVTSVVGRFLEHSRLYYFANGGHGEIFLGSADLMPRNLDRRVETLAPVRSPALVRTLRDEILHVYLNDNSRARDQLADGSYSRRVPDPIDLPLDSQAWFLRQRQPHGQVSETAMMARRSMRDM